MLDSPALDRVFRALSDPTRRRMVEQLARSPASVSALAAPFEMTLAAVVQHIQVLEESGLVRTEKVGRVRLCTVDPKALNAAEHWFQQRRKLWEQNLDRLEDLVRQLPKSDKKGEKP